MVGVLSSKRCSLVRCPIVADVARRFNHFPRAMPIFLGGDARSARPYEGPGQPLIMRFWVEDLLPGRPRAERRDETLADHVIALPRSGSSSHGRRRSRESLRDPTATLTDRAHRPGPVAEAIGRIP